MSALVAATLMLERLAYLAVLPIGVGLACIFGVQVVYADLPEKKHSEIKDLVPEKVKVPVPGKADGPEPAAKLASHSDSRYRSEPKLADSVQFDLRDLRFKFFGMKD